MPMGEIDQQRRDWTIAGAALLAVVAVIAVGLWRQSARTAHLAPKTPFHAYAPPSAPDYAQRAAWALIPATPAAWTASDPPADVFFVHPTTFAGGKDWNGPIGEAAGDSDPLPSILRSQAGPFAGAGRLFAPRYRQASRYAEMNASGDARAARAFAYGDVKRAFDAYLARYNQGRPIILAGVEQGGLLIARLARDELAADPTLRARLAAVYLIDAAVPADDYGPGAVLPACMAKTQARCAVGWITAAPFGEGPARQGLSNALAWTADDRLEPFGERKPLCVNPLLGAASPAFAPARLSKGAWPPVRTPWASPYMMSRVVSAQCAHGLLQASTPRAPFSLAGEPWGYNLFFADIEADARSRVAGLSGQAGFKRVAPPITQSVDVRDVPIAGRGPR
jgi:hypothetical protein